MATNPLTVHIQLSSDKIVPDAFLHRGCFETYIRKFVSISTFSPYPPTPYSTRIHVPATGFIFRLSL
jgi:hypothetical protein